MEQKTLDLTDSDNENNVLLLNRAKKPLKQSLKEEAQQYAQSAIENMVLLMLNTETPATVRLAAADKILDRAFGKPAQEVITSSSQVDSELLERIETEMVAKMQKARERQKAVLEERGLDGE